MPQMMNLMWLPLMIFFSMAMMIMIILLFTMKTPIIKNKMNDLEKKIKNWAW
uniref:ATP synthase F0 subunit 8 n=1 Tax=Euparatettix bimaculatus TaxID=288130 RepID=A0A6G6A6S2_9ORTH|nr:ATP synthase F0 subunit 8 [Euparatettix bimaculatus]QID03658.1 ATP synthase F0 subunit 8 [Euparatettix bimaculatus]